MKVPNADTVLGVLKKLKTEKETVVSERGITYNYNRNDKLNLLNIRIMKTTGLLQEDQLHDFDYDNEVLKTEKYDSKKSYKMVNGYFPGMATIRGMPVYFENRDGNMNVKFKQEDLLERCYEMLKEEGIKIGRSRMDCGSYTSAIVKVLEKFSKKFYLRAMRCDKLEQMLWQVSKWDKIEINYKPYEVCSIEYQPFNNGKNYRLVVAREVRKDGQLNIFTKDSMKYRSILTNDRESTEKEVIEYYNARGGEERTIDVLNNDFGWKHMPFSFMHENTVFLIIQMMCKNLYTFLINKFSTYFVGLKRNFRIKKFIFRFITVPSKWIKKSRQKILKLYTDKPYEFVLT